MPTGYTDVIKDGITFQQFAMNCARAFGACVMMRDDPTDKPIPEKFEPSTWHKKELSKAYKELERINSLNAGEAKEEAFVEFVQEAQRQEEAITKDRKLVGQYKDMLYQVRQWQPLAADHIGLKDFMIQQIESSIKFDSMEDYYIKHAPQKLTGEQWLAMKKQEAQRDIAYHTKENDAEIERTNSRNEWVRALRESLIV